MILLLDSSTPICYIALVGSDDRFDFSWQADRSLARDLLAKLRDQLASHGATLSDLKSIGIMKGPGSFTGLRIGATVANTLARELEIPIVGTGGEAWQSDALSKLSTGESDGIVLPNYGRPARITAPRK